MVSAVQTTVKMPAVALRALSPREELTQESNGYAYIWASHPRSSFWLLSRPIKR
uniref:Uncharacterized protein n=1 Tax=Human herpesvirus 1 TaxID=10298 RepID=A0A2Z4H7Z8_HHV1|nr:hypothetical protein [Human alphaherpesvirus 1]